MYRFVFSPCIIKTLENNQLLSKLDPFYDFASTVTKMMSVRKSHN